MSTSHELVDLFNGISQSLYEERYAVGVFTDKKKHAIRLITNYYVKQIEFLGIHGIACKWLTSYLANRKQLVSTDTCKSDVLCGVPHCSIL